MCGETMTFPDTVEEFMERYKIVDREQVYTNGAELIPIFRMEQWFAHKRGRWVEIDYPVSECSVCKYMVDTLNIATSYCPNCGSLMEESE